MKDSYEWLCRSLKSRLLAAVKLASNQFASCTTSTFADAWGPKNFTKSIYSTSGIQFQSSTTMGELNVQREHNR